MVKYEFLSKNVFIDDWLWYFMCATSNLARIKNVNHNNLQSIQHKLTQYRLQWLKMHGKTFVTGAKPECACQIWFLKCHLWQIYIIIKACQPLTVRMLYWLQEFRRRLSSGLGSLLALTGLEKVKEERNLKAERKKKLPPRYVLSTNKDISPIIWLAKREAFRLTGGI